MIDATGHSEPAEPELGQAETTCLGCGAAAPDEAARQCLACDAPWPVRLVFHSQPEFLRAKVLLKDRGLVRQMRDPGTGLSGFLSIEMGHFRPGLIWIDATAQQEARRALDEAGIAVLERSLPIVDRSEPICPSCQSAVAADGPERCGDCGQPFRWVEIEDIGPPVPADACGRCGASLPEAEPGMPAVVCEACGAVSETPPAQAADREGRRERGRVGRDGPAHTVAEIEADDLPEIERTTGSALGGAIRGIVGFLVIVGFLTALLITPYTVEILLIAPLALGLVWAMWSLFSGPSDPSNPYAWPDG